MFKRPIVSLKIRKNQVIAHSAYLRNVISLKRFIPPESVSNKKCFYKNSAKEFQSAMTDNFAENRKIPRKILTYCQQCL